MPAKAKDKAALEAEATTTAVCGRVMLRRVMGKASFVTLQDVSGRIQCYIRQQDVGEEAYEQFNELWDIGDHRRCQRYAHAHQQG